MILSLILLFSLGGCKHSDVLSERVADQENGVVDDDADPLYEETPDGPKDPTRISTIETENDNINDQDETKATFSRTPNASGKAKERKQEESSNDQETSEGSLEGDASNPTGGEVEGTGREVANGAGDAPGDGEGDGDEEKEQPAGAGGPGVASGGTENEPLLEDVHTVAATGQLALIVQMLCGDGPLVAADESWLARMGSSGAFADEGLEDIATCWSGDGTEAGSADVSALISVHPDAVLLSSDASGLAQAEIDQLLSAGISIQWIPFNLGSADIVDDDIVKAVQMVGEVMRSASSAGYTQYSAPDMAEAYVTYHDQLIDSYVNANGGYSYLVAGGASYGFIYQGTSSTGISTTQLSSNRITTAFIDSWTTLSVASISSQRTYGEARMKYLAGSENVLDCSDGIGLSAYGSTGNFMLIDYYLQCGGVVDNAYEGPRPAYASDGSSRPYTVIAGSFSELDGAASIMQRSRPSALWFSETGDSSSSTSWKTVGDSSFPGIIVRSQEIAQSVLGSAAKANGLYNVGQPYQVYVVPEGLAGSWADGTIESFLLTGWANGCFAQDMSVCTQNIAAFYSSFYRCSSPEAAVQNYYGGSGSYTAGA